MDTSNPQAQGGEPSYSVPAAAFGIFLRTHHLFVASSSLLIRILCSVFCRGDPQTNVHFKVHVGGDPQNTVRFNVYFEGDPQNIVRFAVNFEGDPQNIVLFDVNFEGDPQNIVPLKPYFHTKKHYRNVVNSVLNTERTF